MAMRVILIVSGVVAILVGLLFIFGADSAIQSYNLGESTLVTRLFVRAAGAGILSFGILNLLCVGDIGSRALRAVVVGNLVIHVLSIGVEFSESYVRNTGVWIGLVVHVAFIIAFGYLLLNWKSVPKAAA